MAATTARTTPSWRTPPMTRDEAAAAAADATAARAVADTAAARLVSGGDEVSAAKRSDAARLRAELEGDELAAVRLALGLPVVDALALEAAKRLLACGVTVHDLAEKGYP